MRYGVRDYLLKPVDENELHQVLDRIKNEIAETEKQKHERESRQKQYERALPVISEAFLNKLISQNALTSENIRNEAQKYGMDLSGDAFTVCAVSPDISLQNGEEPEAYEYCRTIVKRAMRKFAGAVTFSPENDKSLLISIVREKRRGEDKQGILASAAGYCGKSAA